MHLKDAPNNINPLNQLNCLNANLRKASRVILSLYMDEMRESDVSGTQFTLLSAIAGFKEAKIGELAEFMSMDQTTVTRNVNLLKKGGYVAVFSGSDKRTRVVHLTEKGQRTVESTQPMWMKAQQKIWSELGEEKALQLLEISELIVQMNKKK
ncbi:MAG: MarR family winged helix-turn-helix transcriptional regulator [Chloroflexota bacterium]